MDQFEESLSVIFTHLSQLCFDKGLELIEKEKETTQPGPFKLLLNQLPNLILAERSYVNLAFVSTKNKMFMRKDNSVRSMYEGLRLELTRLEESSGVDGISDVASQTCQFITVRLQLIDLYEKMFTIGSSNKVIKTDELTSLVDRIMEIQSLQFAHRALTTMKTAVSLECEILMLLLNANIELQNWRFLETLLKVDAAQSKLGAWEKTLQNRESWKLGFGASFLKANPLPPLVQWLFKLKLYIMNKYSLYFHHTLMQQTTPVDYRTICGKHGIDLFQRMQNVQKRHDAMTVMLLFDTAGAVNYGQSYRFMLRGQSLPTEPYVIMVHCPIKLLEQLPTISKAISDRASDLMTMDRVVVCYSLKDQSSYFMTSLDPRVTLVFVFDSKKDERDTSLCKHIMELTLQMRGCNQVFTKLKLNNK